METNNISHTKQLDDLGFYSIIEYDLDSPDIQQKFIVLFADIQRKYVASYPGYISSTFVASTDNKRIYNLVLWRSEADFAHFENLSDTQARADAIDQALKDLENKAHFRRIGSPRYRVLETVFPPDKNE